MRSKVLFAIAMIPLFGACEEPDYDWVETPPVYRVNCKIDGVEFTVDDVTGLRVGKSSSDRNASEQFAYRTKSGEWRVIKPAYLCRAEVIHQGTRTKVMKPKAPAKASETPSDISTKRLDENG